MEKITIVRAIVEIGILWYLFYRIMQFLEGTRAFYVIRGIVILAVFFILSNWLGLYTLNWLLSKVFGISIVVFVILFQPELRQGLARLGQSPFWGKFALDRKEIERVARDITIAVTRLAEKKVGALIAIQKSIGLKGYSDSGIKLDAIVSPELLETIFYPGSPLHDGGVIIKEDRIVASACLFPLTDSERHPDVRGTRHRAGIGISEETDALCIIVSEEMGTISWAINGHLKMAVTPEELYRFLIKNMVSDNLSWADMFRFFFKNKGKKGEAK